MSNIHLYTTFYLEKTPDRLRELQASLKRNSDNSSINTITVFNEEGDLSSFKCSKLQIISIEQRPTYQDFINYINANSNGDDIHIIANTDIYFDKNIEVLKQINLKNTCLALSRWDTTETKKPKLYNHNDSQDVWVFKGHIKPELKANFPIGVPRCDNKLFFELQKAGYNVLNPSFSIKVFHIHKGQRALAYAEGDNTYNIKPPYGYLYPHNLYGFFKTYFFNLTHKEQLGAYKYDIKKLNKWWVIRLSIKTLEVMFNKKMPLIGYK